MTLALAPARPGYSVVEVDADGRVVSLAGKPEPSVPVVSRHVFTGWQLIEDEVFERLPPGKSDTVRDLYRDLAAEGRLQGFVHRGAWVEMGSPVQMLEGVLGLLAAPEAARRAVLDPSADPVIASGGARLALGRGVRPDGTSFAGAVALAAGASVGPGASLEDVVALSGVTIGEGCRLRRVLLAPGAAIPAGTTLEDASVGVGETGEPWVRPL